MRRIRQVRATQQRGRAAGRSQDGVLKQPLKHSLSFRGMFFAHFTRALELASSVEWIRPLQPPGQRGLTFDMAEYSFPLRR